MSDWLDLELLPSLQAARPAWERLAPPNRNLFATYEWAATWAQHLAAGQSPLVAACRRADGSTAGLLALVVRREGRLRVARLLGHGPADRLAPLCAPADRAAVGDALRRILRSSGCDLFVGDQMPAEEGWDAVLGGGVIAREASPVLAIEGLGWEEFLTARSANFRQQVRRHERRLAERRRLRYRLTEEPGRLDGDLDTLFALHDARWRDGGSTAFAGARREFHREFARLALQRGWLRLWLLELDGRPVAAWYGFRFGDAEWFYQSGRDPQFDSDKVGFVLLSHTIREAMHDGMREYRLLRGDEPYKARFADRDPGLQTVAVALGGRGQALLAARRLRPFVGAAVRRLRPDRA